MGRRGEGEIRARWKRGILRSRRRRKSKSKRKTKNERGNSEGYLIRASTWWAPVSTMFLLQIDLDRRRLGELHGRRRQWSDGWGNAFDILHYCSLRLTMIRSKKRMSVQMDHEYASIPRNLENSKALKIQQRNSSRRMDSKGNTNAFRKFVRLGHRLGWSCRSCWPWCQELLRHFRWTLNLWWRWLLFRVFHSRFEQGSERPRRGWSGRCSLFCLRIGFIFLF